MKTLILWALLSLVFLAGAWVLLRADHEADIDTDDEWDALIAPLAGEHDRLVETLGEVGW
jgi:hypothetical protein